METCGNCAGSGWSGDFVLIRQEPCRVCLGYGKVKITDRRAEDERFKELTAWSEYVYFNRGECVEAR